MVDVSSPHTGRRTVLVTLHRRENWGTTIAGIARAVFALVQAHDDMQVVWPLHANPDLAQLIREQMGRAAPAVRARCHLLAPLEYPDLIDVLSNAWLVITDSGGLQEEACSLRVPVLVTRQGTERPELIEAGAGRLVGTDPLNLIREFERIWRDPARHEAMRCSRNPFGDGRASERIAAVLSEWLNEHSAADHRPATRRVDAPDTATGSYARAAALLRPIGSPPAREGWRTTYLGVPSTPTP
jgi:UDP-N-acetylglucosamine 2-epimerase